MVNKCFIWVSVAAASMVLLSEGIMGMDLERYRWQNRLLLLFAAGENTPEYMKIAEEIEQHRHEMKDRDLVVIRLLESGSSKVDGQSLSDNETKQLRTRFEALPGRFKAVLIGKDGGVKLTRNDALRLQEVFDRIDAMPMRQREMRERESLRK